MSMLSNHDNFESIEKAPMEAAVYSLEVFYCPFEARKIQHMVLHPKADKR